MKAIELLAPAKNLEFGKTAINYGADAVYIGADSFSARAAAGNSIRDIELLSNYAHKYNAKVYTAVNTILFDSELIKVKQLINNIYNGGVDALIVQDMGIFELDIPPIELFASTQADCSNINRIKMLEAAGISRVILARELSLSQINEIHKQTNVELEAFIFGALCVSYSGQCYVSQALSGRSANRGECSQICRHKFSLVSDNETIIDDKYLLSLKDLNLHNQLENMIDAGITSFKIEGRLKDINYLKTAVSYFRQKFDKLFEQNSVFKPSSSGKVHFDFEPDIHSAFNRGFSEYFINGKGDELLSKNTPKFVGKQIAKVIENKKDYIVVEANKKINNGDGLSYFDAQGELNGFRVNKAEGNKLYTSPKFLDINKDLILYRNQNTQYEKQLEQSKTNRKIDANISINRTSNLLIFQLIDEDYLIAESVLQIDTENARDIDTYKQLLIKQFSKTNDSIFKIKEFHFQTEELPFLQVSVLNKIRRDLLENLEMIRANEYQRKLRSNAAQIIEYKEVNDFHLNISNELSKKFYKKIGIDAEKCALELTKEYSNKPLMTTKMCILNQLGKCLKNNNEYRDRRLYLIDKSNELCLEFDCLNCQMKIYLNK